MSDHPIRRKAIASAIAGAVGLFIFVPHLHDPDAAMRFMSSAIVLAMMWTWASDPFGPKK